MPKSRVSMQCTVLEIKLLLKSSENCLKGQHLKGKDKSFEPLVSLTGLTQATPKKTSVQFSVSNSILFCILFLSYTLYVVCDKLVLDLCTLGP